MLSDKCEDFLNTHTVDTFATCGLNVRMRKYAQCGPRLSLMQNKLFILFIYKCYTEYIFWRKTTPNYKCIKLFIISF